MKIDRKTFPIISFVQNKNFNDLIFADFFEKDERSLIKSLLKSEPEIQFLSDTIRQKFRNMELNNIYNRLYDTSGIVLFDTLTYIYKVVKNEDEVQLQAYVILQEEVSYFFYAITKKENPNNETIIFYPNLNFPDEITRIFTESFNIFLNQYIIFLNEAEINTKIITSNSKYNPLSSTPFKSDFKYPVKIINEAYFTNYIKGKPFKVHEHLRQYKSGKVAYIRPFKKLGYTRKAGKITSNLS